MGVSDTVMLSMISRLQLSKPVPTAHQHFSVNLPHKTFFHKRNNLPVVVVLAYTEGWAMVPVTFPISHSSGVKAHGISETHFRSQKSGFDDVSIIYRHDKNEILSDFMALYNY